MERKALASSKAAGEGGGLGMEVEAGINTAVCGGLHQEESLGIKTTDFWAKCLQSKGENTPGTSEGSCG